MDTEEFPDCCGIIVINRFKGGHPTSDPEDCASIEQVDKYLSRQEKEFYGKRSGLMAILSEPQNSQIGQVFIDRKWVLLYKQAGVMNPRTGRKLFIYFRDLNPTEARERRIFGH